MSCENDDVAQENVLFYCQINNYTITRQSLRRFSSNFVELFPAELVDSAYWFWGQGVKG